MATLTYSGSTSITLSAASIATSATWVAGAESTVVDNTSNVYQDVMVEGKVTVGTTPTINTEIRIYVYGSRTSPASTAIDVIDGADSAETLTSAGVRDGFLILAKTLVVDATTSDRAYPFTFWLGDCMSGVPPFWGLFLTHNTGVNLNSTGGNHVFAYTGYKY